MKKEDQKGEKRGYTESERAAKQERKRKRKEKKEEAQRRKDKEKENKEAFKRSPAGKADAWITETQKYLSKCHRILDEIKTATKTLRAIQHAWTVTITKRMQKVKDVSLPMPGGSNSKHRLPRRLPAYASLSSSNSRRNLCAWRSWLET